VTESPELTNRSMSIKVVIATGAIALASALPLRGETQSVEFGVHKKMDSELIAPDGPGPYPGILLIHTAAGIETYDLDYARRLAGQGYVVLAPRFLAAYHAVTVLRAFREHMFKADGPSMYDDFVAGLALLRDHPKVRGSKLGAIGFSAGGYFALWLAATRKVQAGVSYYGAVHAAGGDPNLDLFRRVFAANSSPVIIFHGTGDDTVLFEYATLLDRILTEKNCVHQFYRALIGRNKPVVDDAWQKTLAFFDQQLRH
jgi:dienelactone hydrolase